jgi:hypothetical protein
MQLTYLYSMIYPCYCQASKMFSENKTITPIKINNYNHIIAGCVMEKRYEKDEYDREHIKTVFHCDKCNRKPTSITASER